MSMEIDAKTYLITFLRTKLYNLSKATNVSEFAIADYVDKLFGERGLKLDYGAIKYSNSKQEGDIYYTEVITFVPRDLDKTHITMIQIGNIFNHNGLKRASFNYNMLLSGCLDNYYFDEFNCIVDLSENASYVANATVVIHGDNDNDPYKGIYCIKVKEPQAGGEKTVIEYYNSEILDTVEKVDNGVIPYRELITSPSRILKSVGIIPSKVVTLDYDEVIKPYKREKDIVINTFLKGTRENFREWVDKVIFEKGKAQEKGPVKEKRING